jgi:hypothetical protein
MSNDDDFPNKNSRPKGGNDSSSDLMSKKEARKYTNRLREKLLKSRYAMGKELQEARDLKVHKSLGYNSFNEYMEEELADVISTKQGHTLAHVADVVDVLLVEEMEFSQSCPLYAIKPLIPFLKTPDKIPLIWDEAMDMVDEEAWPNDEVVKKAIHAVIKPTVDGIGWEPDEDESADDKYEDAFRDADDEHNPEDTSPSKKAEKPSTKIGGEAKGKKSEGKGSDSKPDPASLKKRVLKEIVDDVLPEIPRENDAYMAVYNMVVDLRKLAYHGDYIEPVINSIGSIIKKLQRIDLSTDDGLDAVYELLKELARGPMKEAQEELEQD